MASKHVRTINNNNRRAASTRRRRGYQWENTLTKRFNGAEGWRAFRLGSPSVGLPDILAVGSAPRMLYAIEAKSGSGTLLSVPACQIERCLEWVKTFDVYKKRRHAVLAFKFLSKKRIGLRKYERRELREYYKIWDESLDLQECVCTYDGKIFVKNGGARFEITLKECKMPFGD